MKIIYIFAIVLTKKAIKAMEKATEALVNAVKKSTKTKCIRKFKKLNKQR